MSKNKKDDNIVIFDSLANLDIGGSFTYSSDLISSTNTVLTFTTGTSTTSGGAGGVAGGGAGGVAGGGAGGGAGGITWNASSLWPVVDNLNTFTWHDELGDFKREQAEEKKLREEYSVLQDSWDQYQLIKKLLQEEEADKYVKDKYKGFGK